MNINASYSYRPYFSGNSGLESNNAIASNGSQPNSSIPLSNKQIKNLAVVHETFEKTAKLAAPNANQQECQAWVNAGDKAMIDSVSVFQKAFQKTHDKASAQMETSNYAANAFLPNLLATPDGRSFLVKANENSTKQK